MAAYLLEIGLTLCLLMLNTWAIPVNATNGHKKHQRYLTFTKISALKGQKQRRFDRSPFQIGMFC